MSGAPVLALDCGETLFDETRQWSVWASWLGVPPFTLMVALGAVLERNQPFSTVFSLFDADFDIDQQIALRRARCDGFSITASDLHPDVLPCLATLAAAGRPAVIAGTMTAQEQDEIRALELPVATVISGRELGHRNREAGFFVALSRRLAVPVGDLLYLSHRSDTAGVAARQAGAGFGYLRRGPLAYLRPATGGPAAAEPRFRIESLAELPAQLS
ncbi:MAG: hypothetical protein ACR2N4_03655 [Jatrophihabitans sp.]